MSVMICSTRYGGCGHVSSSVSWGGFDCEGIRYDCCPSCGDDSAAFQLTLENFDSLTSGMSEEAAEKARKMINEAAICAC